MNVFECFIISGHGNIVKRNRFHSNLWKILLRYGRCNLSATICSEIEAQQNIAFIDSSFFGFDDTRLKKLIGDILFIIAFAPFCKVGCRLAFSMNQKIISVFYTLPSFIAVHGIVPSDHGNQLRLLSIKFFFQLRNSIHRISWSRITTVSKGMNKYIIHRRCFQNSH